MSESSQIDLLPADQAAELLRKRRFWKWTMWISLILGVILAVSAVSGYVINMMRAFSNLKESGSADPAALANDISAALLITMWTLPFACASLLIAMVSFIRLLSLPKRDTGTGGAFQR